MWYKWCPQTWKNELVRVRATSGPKHETSCLNRKNKKIVDNVEIHKVLDPNTLKAQKENAQFNHYPYKDSD